MKKRVFVGGFILGVMVAVIWFAGLRDYFNLDVLKADSERLQLMVVTDYWQSVLLYIVLYAGITLLFLPFVALLTVGGGFLFGTFGGAVYTVIGATLGSMGAFLLVRYFVGELVQERYKVQLMRFNQAMEEGQISYLLAVHFIAVIPFPVVNLLAALTRVPLWTFIWTTAVGIFPGSLVCAFAGNQLTTIHSLKDIVSVNIIIAFSSLVLLALLPLIIQWIVRKKRGGQL